MTTAKPPTGLPSMLADGDPRPRRFNAPELQAMLDAGIITADEMPGIRGGKSRPFIHVEYHDMDADGVFAPEERVQLVVGAGTGFHAAGTPRRPLRAGPSAS